MTAATAILAKTPELLSNEETLVRWFDQVRKVNPSAEPLFALLMTCGDYLDAVDAGMVAADPDIYQGSARLARRLFTMFPFSPEAQKARSKSWALDEMAIIVDEEFGHRLH